MPRISDKRLREVLQAATVDAGHDVPWRPEWTFFAPVRSSSETLVTEVPGNRDRFHVAELLALAPELAEEVLRLRREVRRLRKVVG